MTSQLQLTPENVHPETYRYQPTEEGAAWQIEDWRSLVGKFSLIKDQVVQWHHALAGQGRPWEIIRRVYQIAPLYGDELTPDDYRIWKVEELAAKWSVSPKDITNDLDAAVKFWKRTTEDKDLADRIRSKESGAMPEFKSGVEVDDDEISPLLEKFGFGNQKVPANRKFIARRITELRPQFETPVYRETARQVVQMEVNMRIYESLLAIHQLAIEKALQDAATKNSIPTTKNIEENFRKTESTLTNLAKEHRTLLEEIGADNEEADSQVRTAMDSFGHATDAMTRYYAKGDRELLDGVFTAGELRFLLTPTDVREFQQYRPDIVVRIREALLPENLWAADAKVEKLPRDICRKLKKICDGLTEAQDGTIPAIDNGLSEDGDEDEAVDQTEAPALEMSAAEIQKLATPSTPSYRDDDEGDFVVAEET